MSAGNPLTTPTAVGLGGTLPFQARGVRVNISGTVPSVLPSFVIIVQTFVQDTAAARPTASPTAMPLVVPIAVSSVDMRAAFIAHSALYDLLAHPVTPASSSSVQPSCTTCRSTRSPTV